MEEEEEEKVIMYKFKMFIEMGIVWKGENCNHDNGFNHLSIFDYSYLFILFISLYFSITFSLNLTLCLYASVLMSVSSD